MNCVVAIRDRPLFDKGYPMNYDWTENVETVDWNELVELYRRAPLGTKNPNDLKTVFVTTQVPRKNLLFCK